MRLLSCPLPAGRHPSHPKTARSWHSQSRMRTVGRSSQPSSGGCRQRGAPPSALQAPARLPCTLQPQTSAGQTQQHSGLLLGKDSGGKRPGAGCPLSWWDLGSHLHLLLRPWGTEILLFLLFREAHVTNREGGSKVAQTPPSSHPPTVVDLGQRGRGWGGQAGCELPSTMVSISPGRTGPPTRPPPGTPSKVGTRRIRNQSTSLLSPSPTLTCSGQ